MTVGSNVLRAVLDNSLEGWMRCEAICRTVAAEYRTREKEKLRTGKVDYAWSQLNAVAQTLARTDARWREAVADEEWYRKRAMTAGIALLLRRLESQGSDDAHPSSVIPTASRQHAGSQGDLGNADHFTSPTKAAPPATAQEADICRNVHCVGSCGRLYWDGNVGSDFTQRWQRLSQHAINRWYRDLADRRATRRETRPADGRNGSDHSQRTPEAATAGTVDQQGTPTNTDVAGTLSTDPEWNRRLNPERYRLPDDLNLKRDSE